MRRPGGRAYPPGLSAGITRYQWNTGATTPTLRITQAGTYTITVTNASGCTATAQVRFTTPPVPTLVLPTDTASCGGTLVLRPRGLRSDVVDYRWSTGATTPTLGVTQAGTYALTVTNAAGCTATARTVLTVPVPPALLLAPIPLFAEARWCVCGNEPHRPADRW